MPPALLPPRLPEEIFRIAGSTGLACDSTRELRAAVIGEWLQTEARYLA
jgi:hypothetical protein